jgi:hypothetical protein
MSVSVDYSVRTHDIEEARAWVEDVTGLVAEGRESLHWGGDYYAFYGDTGEKLKLITNRDPIDQELIIGNDPSVLIGLIVDGAGPESSILAALKHAPEKFAKLTESSY